MATASVSCSALAHAHCAQLPVSRRTGVARASSSGPPLPGLRRVNSGSKRGPSKAGLVRPQEPLVQEFDRLNVSRTSVIRRAKFQEFDRSIVEEEVVAAGVAAAESEGERERDDSVMPTSLEDAISQAARAAGAFSAAGGSRALVEITVPEFVNLSDDGAQQRVWDAGRQFLEEFVASVPNLQVKAVYADAGVAALNKHQWPDAPVTFGSLNDRTPVTLNDDVVVLIYPEYQQLAEVERIASLLRNEDSLPRPLVMFNPKLQSGDVGIGLNVRRMREFFLGTFQMVYFLQPLGDSALFRCYPEPWKFFLPDTSVSEAGRYVLAGETLGRPTEDEMEAFIMGETGVEPTAMESAQSIFTSFNRFLKALSN